MAIVIGGNVTDEIKTFSGIFKEETPKDATNPKSPWSQKFCNNATALKSKVAATRAKIGSNSLLCDSSIYPKITLHPRPTL
jgi:hypothetical protein